MVVAYFQWPDFARWADEAGAFKARSGPLFAMVSNQFAGVIIPIVAILLTRVHRPLTIRDFAFQLGFFGVMGLVVDWLYTGLGALFGPSQSIGTVVLKLIADEGVFTPIFAMPFAVILFLWRDRGFSGNATLRALRAGEFRNRYFPTLVTCWCFWTPVLCAIYAMPTRLQFCLFLFAEACWSLILVYVGTTDALQ